MKSAVIRILGAATCAALLCASATASSWKMPLPGFPSGASNAGDRTDSVQRLRASPSDAAPKPQRPPVAITVASELLDAPGKRVVGATLRFVVTVTMEGAVGDATFNAPAPPRLDGLELRKSRTRDVVLQGSVTREYIYEVAPVREGKVSIGPTTVRYTEADGGQPGSIEAAGLEFEAGPAPADHRRLTIVVALSVLAVLGAGVGVAAVVKGASLSGGEATSPRPSPYEALRDDDDALEASMVDGDGQDLFVGIAKRVRDYLAIDEGADVRRETTGQIQERLDAGEHPREDGRRVADLLERCDAIRYAGGHPTREACEAIMRDWKSLVAERIGRRDEEQKQTE